MTIRLSANLGFLWPDRPLLSRIDAAAAAGFEAVELHWPYDVPAQVLRDAVDRRSLTLLSVNTPVGGRPGDFGLAAVPGREEEFASGYDQALRYAVDAGARSIHVMAGVVAPGGRDEARRTLIANLRRIGQSAAKAGLMLLLEPINRIDRPGYVYDDVADAAAIIAEAGCPALSLMFDFYHAAITEADPIASFRRHLPAIGHIQIAAAPSRAEPDEGALDYRLVFQAIEASGYAGLIGCEYKPRRETDAGLVWRESLIPTSGWERGA